MSFSLGDLLEPQDADNENKKSSLKTYARLTGLGFELIVLVILGLFANRWLETKVNLKSLGPMIFLFLALGIWIYRIVITLSKIDRDEKNAQETIK